MYVTTRAFESDLQTTVEYQAGFIVLSYAISLVGCMSTLELLHRRTSSRGAFNWYLLIASSITMGGIGIWSMHFVGNRAIILANGATDRQLVYNQGYTALSFFLPIMVLVIAFYLLAISGKASKINIFIAGLLTGTAVCAMHYVGQVGVANYDCTYRIGNIVGAAIIAVCASLIALSVFFRLRETWTDSWWKRALCAGLLAGAVSGMHWTATLGTTYYFRLDDMSQGSRTRVQTVIFCAVLSLASCIFLLAVAFITRHRSRVHRKRAQELVLACAYFDEDNRVMVSNDGFLPYQKITNQFVRKTFGEDELSRTHPAFMWVYEASRNWNTLYELVPGMQECLDSDPIANRYQPGHQKSIDLPRAASSDFNIIFKQLFCVAADRLATQLHSTMEQLGVLFEEPLETGTTKPSRTVRKQLTGYNDLDAEKGREMKLFGKGRYLVLNRRLTKSEAADYAALGYRFGSIFHVAESLARNMQVSSDSMMSQLERMKVCISRDRLHPPGVHLTCFLLRPSIHDGFDILVPAVCQNQLPLISLPMTEITPSHQTVLQSLDEWTVRDILKELIPEEEGQTDKEKDFRWQLYSAFVRLVDMVQDPVTMMEAIFSAKPVQAPSRGPEGTSKPSSCLLLSVRYLGSIHHSYTHKELTYVPFSFFCAQQLLESSPSRHQTFKQKAELEFGQCLDTTRKRTQSEANTLATDQDEVGDLERRVPLSSWSSRNLLLKLGLKKQKISRQSSRTGLYPDLQSGRSTAEPDVDDPAQISKTDANASTEEVHQLKSTDTSTPLSNKGPQNDRVRQEDTIQIITVSETESQGSFVSELFALFNLSSVPEKEVVNQTT